MRGPSALSRAGGMKKGDVLTVAQVAGVMGAKRTPELIPMCHPILIDGIDLKLSLDPAEAVCGDRGHGELRRQDRGGDGGSHRRQRRRPQRCTTCARPCRRTW